MAFAFDSFVDLELGVGTKVSLDARNVPPARSW